MFIEERYRSWVKITLACPVLDSVSLHSDVLGFMDTAKGGGRESLAHELGLLRRCMADVGLRLPPIVHLPVSPIDSLFCLEVSKHKSGDEGARCETHGQTF